MKDLILIGILLFLIFTIQCICCYWLFLLHWSVGIVGICIMASLNIIGYMEHNNW